MAADPALAGTQLGAEALRVQRFGTGAAGDDGTGHWVSLACGRVLGGGKELSRNGALRGTLVDELAPSHGFGRAGASVYHAHAAALEKKLPS